jgi:hypothetical protein
MWARTKGDRVILTKYFIAETAEEICINFVIGLSARYFNFALSNNACILHKLKSDFMLILYQFYSNFPKIPPMQKLPRNLCTVFIRMHNIVVPKISSLMNILK